MPKGLRAAGLLLVSPTLLAAQPDSSRADSVRVSVGAYVDSYIAWDDGRPRTLDRNYTTQPARHAEFNVNLAFVEATLQGPRLRGRLALQAGTSVQSNYAAEPRVGAISGGDLARTLQEATIGVAVHPRVWIDGGVYFSYIGLEGWISRDNPTYTRSLIADYTPYYLSGAKVTWQATRTVTAQVHVINGWQNISETNRDKAVGTRLDWQPRDDVLVGWGMFVGNEQPDSAPAQLRVLNQVLGRWRRGPWELSAVFDGGRQARVDRGADWWTGSTVIARRALRPTVHASARLEHLFDRGQVLVRTDAPGGFRTSGGSMGLDVRPQPRLLWRSEVRALRSRDAIWPRDGAPRGARSNWLAVTSLALTL
ncbi:MAG: porin [Gemmatimonadetes bacterium]|nr:porin [Gemmatimonadota bacterium]